MSNTDAPLPFDFKETLKKLALFEKFTPEQSEWLLENSTYATFEAGENITRHGASGEALWVLLQGEWRLSRPVGQNQVVLNTTDWVGSWMGGIPLLDGNYMTDSVATRPSHFLRIPMNGVRFMIDNNYPIVSHLLDGISTGARNSQALVLQHEKMAALGKLSAGLAHELNNPAAAVQRAAAQLQEAFQTCQTTLLSLGATLSPAQLEITGQLYREVLAHRNTRLDFDSLAQSELEDEITGWLDDREIENGWQVAATLAGNGLDIAWLEQLNFDPVALSKVLNWFEASLSARDLVRQIEQSSQRISTLVRSVKEYSYMDQAPQQEIDIHQGLENTLTMLGHKLKGIEIEREYDRTLPRIMAYGSQLNQVWTNLLDNAADALKNTEDAQITVRTRHESEFVVVEIADTGPGIPPEVQSHVFEPFFTTKGVGEGSGMGLEITYRIIVSMHKGELNLTSRPGNTCFQIRLPLV